LIFFFIFICIHNFDIINIYIYIIYFSFDPYCEICLDDTYLLAVPEDLVMLSPNEYANVIIPCRPTSPDVNVTLFKDDEEVIYYRFQYTFL
jgi:hypothetical protein